MHGGLFLRDMYQMKDLPSWAPNDYSLPRHRQTLPNSVFANYLDQQTKFSLNRRTYPRFCEYSND